MDSSVPRSAAYTLLALSAAVQLTCARTLLPSHHPTVPDEEDEILLRILGHTLGFVCAWMFIAALLAMYSIYGIAKRRLNILRIYILHQIISLCSAIILFIPFIIAGNSLSPVVCSELTRGEWLLRSLHEFGSPELCEERWNIIVFTTLIFSFLFWIVSATILLVLWTFYREETIKKGGGGSGHGREDAIRLHPSIPDPPLWKKKYNSNTSTMTTATSSSSSSSSSSSTTSSSSLGNSSSNSKHEKPSTTKARKYSLPTTTSRPKLKSILPSHTGDHDNQSFNLSLVGSNNNYNVSSSSSSTAGTAPTSPTSPLSASFPVRHPRRKRSSSQASRHQHNRSNSISKSSLQQQQLQQQQLLLVNEDQTSFNVSDSSSSSSTTGTTSSAPKRRCTYPAARESQSFARGAILSQSIAENQQQDHQTLHEHEQDNQDEQSIKMHDLKQT